MVVGRQLGVGDGAGKVDAFLETSRRHLFAQRPLLGPHPREQQAPLRHQGQGLYQVAQALVIAEDAVRMEQVGAVARAQRLGQR